MRMKNDLYLGLESGGEGFSLALVSNGQNCGELLIGSPQRQLVHLFPALKNWMHESEFAFSQIKGVGVALGPGGYTGLRLGLITAKTLAQVLQVPMRGMNSLDLLAHNFLPASGLVLPLTDARKKEIYTAVYRAENGKIERLSDYWAIPPEALAEKLTSYREPLALLGGGCRVYREALEQTLGAKALFLPPAFDHPRALFLALETEREILAGRGSAYAEIGPFYLRPPDAVLPKIPELKLKLRSETP